MSGNKINSLSYSAFRFLNYFVPNGPSLAPCTGTQYEGYNSQHNKERSAEFS